MNMPYVKTKKTNVLQIKKKTNANLKREKPMSQGFTLLCNKLYLVSFSYAPLKRKLLSLNHIMGSRLSSH
jgi:hypothetical protein